ncbi:hypothetical protein, partial [Bifidobacterium coryneforme]|uniref:hypothetical protein n=1 Tax=Bifidobacterium coryneforme TaxID=1687 RepID=UPI0019D3E4BF
MKLVGLPVDANARCLSITAKTQAPGFVMNPAEQAIENVYTFRLDPLSWMASGDPGRCAGLIFFGGGG